MGPKPQLNSKRAFRFGQNPKYVHPQRFSKTIKAAVHQRSQYNILPRQLRGQWASACILQPCPCLVLMEEARRPGDAVPCSALFNITEDVPGNPRLATYRCKYCEWRGRYTAAYRHSELRRTGRARCNPRIGEPVPYPYPPPAEPIGTGGEADLHYQGLALLGHAAGEWDAQVNVADAIDAANHEIAPGDEVCLFNSFKCLLASNVLRGEHLCVHGLPYQKNTLYLDAGT